MRSRPLRLVDVTGSAGIKFHHETGAFGRKWFPETNGSGAAIFDYDGDGLPDIFVSNIVCPSKILESNFLFLSTGQTERMKDGIAEVRFERDEIGFTHTESADFEAELEIEQRIRELARPRVAA